eukprot:12652962-Alexandrium_andersonii.AAC.1
MAARLDTAMASWEAGRCARSLRAPWRPPGPRKSRPLAPRRPHPAPHRRASMLKFGGAWEPRTAELQLRRSA